MVIGVPLLDMQRYTKLGAGASWVAEYGDPDTTDWELHVEVVAVPEPARGVDYPPVFFYVDEGRPRAPGHARKMAAAKMGLRATTTSTTRTWKADTAARRTVDQLAYGIAPRIRHLRGN